MNFPTLLHRAFYLTTASISGGVGQGYEHMLIYAFFKFLAWSFLSMVGALELLQQLPTGSAYISYIIHNQNSSQFQVLYIFGPWYFCLSMNFKLYEGSCFTPIVA